MRRRTRGMLWLFTFTIIIATLTYTIINGVTTTDSTTPSVTGKAVQQFNQPNTTTDTPRTNNTVATTNTVNTTRPDTNDTTSNTTTRRTNNTPSDVTQANPHEQDPKILAPAYYTNITTNKQTITATMHVLDNASKMIQRRATITIQLEQASNSQTPVQAKNYTVAKFPATLTLTNVPPGLYKLDTYYHHDQQVYNFVSTEVTV